jgi:hypothetical protein
VLQQLNSGADLTQLTKEDSDNVMIQLIKDADVFL